MAMVGMELTLLGGVTLWIRVVELLRPSNSVTHTLHDGYNLYRLDIEVVL